MYVVCDHERCVVCGAALEGGRHASSASLSHTEENNRELGTSGLPSIMTRVKNNITAVKNRLIFGILLLDQLL